MFRLGLEFGDVKRPATLVLVMLAMSASAAVEARALALEGPKTQWAPTRNSSELNARAVFAGESRRPASPYAGEGGATAAGSGEARYYDSKLGLFLSRDSFEGALGDAPSLHRFTYAHNNPLRYVDPSGRCVGDECTIEDGNTYGPPSAATPIPNADGSTPKNHGVVPADQRPPEPFVVGGKLCDANCLIALKDQNLYSVEGGESTKLVSGAVLKKAWQSIPSASSPRAEMSPATRAWKTRSQIHAQSSGMSPQRQAERAAVQEGQTAESYYRLVRDNQSGVERDVFDESREAGGHDLGMWWTGQGYVGQQLSEEERSARLHSGAGKLAEKGLTYGAVVSMGAAPFRPMLPVDLFKLSRSGAADATTVGRWMSEAEYTAMREMGFVQESLSGTTHVANPANVEAFMAQARGGSFYVEFEVPTASLRPTSEGWAKIVGPSSLEGRLAAKKGLPVPQMPAANAVEHKATKLP